MDGSGKAIYFLAIFVGSAVGGYVPTFFGVGFLSLWSIISSGVFALLGIYIAYKIMNY